MKFLCVLCVLCAAPVKAQVLVGVEARRDRFTYHFDNPSSIDSPFLVPHFFEQRYVADNLWLVGSASYVAGIRWETTAGITPQRNLLALSVGDHMGNLISPFWAVVGAGIVHVDFRQIFGYRLIFAAIWFTLGVLIFTFLPC